jgi:hypothetical protein
MLLLRLVYGRLLMEVVIVYYDLLLLLCDVVEPPLCIYPLIVLPMFAGLAKM